MKKQNHINFVTVALFFGVICTFMIYFGLTAAVSQSPASYDLEQSLNRAVFENEDLERIIKEINFRLFERVDNDNVIIGSDGFLFERTDEESGYGYLLDYQGELSFSDDELEAIKNNIELRRAAYENAGAEYLIVFVPNSQTVYSEKMPFYYGNISQKTRLSVLSSYLENEEIGCFLNVTDALIASKGDGLLYNNTENSLNALGAYKVYSSVINELADSLPKSYEPYEAERSGFYSHLDTGRAIARSAGIQNLAQNLTVSFSSPPAAEYYIAGEYEEFFITDSSQRSNASVLIECNEEWNRIIMQPYFSNTFETVAYKSNHMFSLLANDKAKPDFVIQFVYEYELDDLASPKVALTYGAGFENEGSIMKTKAPTLIGTAYLDADSVCIFGITEVGSTVTVRGEGIDTVSQSSSEGLFFMQVDIPDGKRYISIQISAKFGAKKESEPIEYALTRSETDKECNVAVGSDSQIFGTKYSASNMESAQEALGHISTPPNISTIRELAGKNTQYVCAVVPTKLTAYKDTAPESLSGTANRLEAIRELFVARDGRDITIIDLSEDMRAAGTSGLYYATDSLPTDKGSYEIYRSVITSLGLEVTVGEEKISIFDTYIPGGSLVSELSFNTTVVCEVTQKYLINDSRVKYFYKDSGDTAKRFWTVNSDTSLPTAIILYDEYGAASVQYMVENFSKAIVYSQDDFRLVAEDIENFKPDYIIKIVGEDNLIE